MKLSFLGKYFRHKVLDRKYSEHKGFESTELSVTDWRRLTKIDDWYIIKGLQMYIDTNNWGLKVELFGQISLPQSPRQGTFWASAGFKSTDESVTFKNYWI